MKAKITESRKIILTIILLTLTMAYNYKTNDFNKNNTWFKTFQSDSESLVVDMIHAKDAGLRDTGLYGLGHYNAETKTVSPYISQYGLQGKIFQLFHKIPGKHVACLMLTAFVFALIVILVNRKYGFLLAFCFFITFLLSPWIVNFARNLYWVEFTWFFPMLIGLYLSLDYGNLKKSVLCYAAVFVSVLIKSLCGYEYLTVILLAMIAFPLVDFCENLFARDWKKSAVIFKSIFVMGAVAVLGFVVAILIHANLKGEGNLTLGIKRIYENDVLRRTLGGKVENFSSVYKDSLEASIPEVILLYYKYFQTEIIAGISGKRFLLISILPIVIFICQFVLEKLNKRDIAMFFVFYVTCISWFVFGKSHSFIHTHMNYVLWYFGFIQTCFYIILKQIIELARLGLKFILENRSEIQNRILEGD